MKKTVLILSLVFTFSCSSDQEVNYPANEILDTQLDSNQIASKFSNDDIKAMFSNYFNSEEYLSTRLEVEKFTNALGSKFEPTGEETEEEILNWIGNNLQHTAFNNISEAQDSWNNIINLKKIENNKFSYIGEILISSPIDVIQCIYIEWFKPVNTTSSICDSTLESCMAVAVGNHAIRAVESMDLKTGMMDAKKQSSNELKLQADTNQSKQA